MKKALRKVMAFALAGTMVLGSASVAFAATTTWNAPTTQIPGDPNQKYITVSAHRAAQTISEILGLTNTCGQNLGGDAKGLVDGMSDEGEPTSLAAGQITPILGLFGSDLNDNPDPYYYNYFYNLYADANGLAKSDYGIYYIPASVGPNNTDTIASTVPGHEGEITSLIRRPDILIGTGAVNNLTYKDLIAQLPDAATYSPIIAKYNYTTIYDISDTMDTFATYMHQVSEKTGKTWRYDDPTVIASDYEKYICGLSAYVKTELAKKGLAEKKVAIIDPAHSDVSGDGTFRAYDTSCASAVAKTCRVAESVNEACENLATAYKAAGQTYTSTIDSKDSIYMTAKQILEADVIITCGIQSDMVVSTDSFKAELMELTGCKESDIPTIIDEQPDCIYGLHVNSSESAVGVGFFLGAIYNDELDLNPVYASAYFYQKLMHINDADALQTAIINNMTSAVQSLGTGVTTDLSNYDAAKIENAIVEGLNTIDKDPSKFNFQGHTVNYDRSTGIGSVAADSINIIANGKTVDCAALGQEALINSDNRTMVPLRAVSEALGAEVTWDGTTRTAKAVLDGSTVTIAIGDNHVVVDGVSKTIDTQATISNSRTLVPVRAISEAFNKSVAWNAKSRTVVIKG